MLRNVNLGIRCNVSFLSFFSLLLQGVFRWTMGQGTDVPCCGMCYSNDVLPTFCSKKTKKKMILNQDLKTFSLKISNEVRDFYSLFLIFSIILFFDIFPIIFQYFFNNIPIIFFNNIVIVVYPKAKKEYKERNEKGTETKKAVFTPLRFSNAKVLSFFQSCHFCQESSCTGSMS